MISVLVGKALAVFRVGAVPPFNSSQSRLTIFTNILMIWGLCAVPSMISLLSESGISSDVYGISYLVMAGLCIVGYTSNLLGQVRFARFVGVVLLNYTGVQCAIFYGKTFNGFWGAYVVAIAYTVLSMSREPRWLFWSLVALSLSGLPVVDWLHWNQLIPVTGLNSSNFPVSILIADTIVFTFFLVTMLTIEKSFYDSYEDELRILNNNLESIVQRRTQMLVEAKEEAIEASLLKSQFVANTSHELRTPVQGLVGFVELAQKRIAKQSSLSADNETHKEKALKSLAYAERSSERLMSLIETLLKITTAESQGFVPKPRPFSVAQVVKEIIATSRERSQNRSIRLLVSDDFSGRATTDSTLVTQVVDNLISNALRYSHEDSEIVVELHEDKYEIRISVVNRGPGVAKQDVERIFDPFVQGTRTDQRIGGTGLGLSLCRKYARALNGHIYLKDASPEHTEFVFDFPRQLNVTQSVTGSANGLADRSPEA